MTIASAPKIDLASMLDHDLAELAIQLAGRVVPGVRMTESAFERCFLDHYKAEWIAGEVVLLSPVNADHNDIVTWFTALFFAFEQELELGRTFSDFWLRLGRQNKRRVPDVMFVLGKPGPDTLKHTYLNDRADIVVEVISTDSQKRDRHDKYEEYERVGVREYFIVDPFTQTCDLYRHNGKQFAPVPVIDGSLASEVIPGFKLDVKAMFRRPLPRVSLVLKSVKAAQRRKRR